MFSPRRNLFKKLLQVCDLVHTANDIEDLIYLYKDCTKRMDDAHFYLRSCNSNNTTLRNLMTQDGRIVTHGSSYEKVLGYLYNPLEDSMQLKKLEINSDANTKRSILSESAKVFDPLSVTVPVTVRCKTLISSLWAEKSTGNHWDEVVSGECCSEWTKLSQDLAGLSTVTFPRSALSSRDPVDFYLFTDASKKAYGYVVYAVQKGHSNIVFSKAKVAPRKKKTLPTLELLGVFQVVKFIFKLVNIYRKFRIKSIYLAVDAQVVLSWLLTERVKIKNIFAANRIKDIQLMISDLKTTYSLNVHFKYVPTRENPADLLTRGLTLAAFKEDLDFWLKGPT